ncbi:MAG: HrpE/YscL family type III secretion apparatus protein [Pirellulales bacterium]|nr:HrpE/YscL family type III secretion apparatus protein [Pirellulales bacterium]
MLQLTDLSLQPDQTVVSAEQYQTMLDAQAIIRSAQEQADQIQVEAQAEYERQKQQGYDDGMMRGRQEIAEEMVNSVSEAVNYLSKLEEQTIELVTRAVRKVIGGIDQHERIVAVVQQALAVARSQTKATVRVCAEEVDAVHQRLDEIMRPYPNIQFLDVVADSRLSSGGCILETDVGIVDASVDVQLAAIEKSLAKSLGFSGNQS